MLKFNGVNRIKGFMWGFTLTLLSIVSANADVYVDGQLIDGNDINEIKIAQPGGRIDINTKGNYTVTNTGSGGSTTNLVVNLSASATSVVVGSTVSLTWSSTNATGCVGLGSWSGGKNVSGTEDFTLNSPGNYSFTLKCSASDGTQKQRSVTIKVSDDTVVPTTCNTPPLSGTTESWSEVWKVPFPSPAWGDDYTQVLRNGYLAIEFDTGDFHGVGSFRLVETTTSPGFRRGSISACPGDFDVEPVCQQRWGLSTTLPFSTTAGSSICKLRPNTTYYFNVTFTDGVDPSSSTCVSRSCIIRAQVGVRAVN